MNFTNSSQKKSWIFSQESLNACKARAVTGSFSSRGRVQKFASGFHQARENDSSSPLPTTMTKTSSAPPTIPFTPIRSLTPEVRTGVLSVRDQETLVQFHAHQIQTLVGPYALLKELRRSQKVLSTAIVLFRRFFLSNSVAEFNPRKMATAAAFLAAKLEEERVEVRPPLRMLFSFRSSFRHGRRDCWWSPPDNRYPTANRTCHCICKIHEGSQKSWSNLSRCVISSCKYGHF